VLVVDDEYGPRESIAFTLSSEFEVETASRAIAWPFGEPDCSCPFMTTGDCLVWLLWGCGTMVRHMMMLIAVVPFFCPFT